MNKDPTQIAEHLIQQHGSPDAAMKVAIKETAEANKADDLYALSVWRDVKRILQEMSAE